MKLLTKDNSVLSLRSANTTIIFYIHFWGLTLNAIFVQPIFITSRGKRIKCSLYAIPNFTPISSVIELQTYTHKLSLSI